MPRMSKKRKQEWALFLNERNRITNAGYCKMRCAQRQSGTVPNRPTHIGRRFGSCPKGSKRCAGRCICATILPSAPA